MIAVNSEYLKTTDIDLFVAIADAFSTFIPVPRDTFHARTEMHIFFSSLKGKEIIQTKHFFMWFSFLWKYILS